MREKLQLLIIALLLVANINAQNQGFTTYNQGTQFVSIEVDEGTNRVWAVKRFVGNSIMKLEQNQDPVPTEFTTFEGITPTGTPLKNYFIRDIAIDGDGNVWVGHYGYGSNNVVGGVEKIRPDLSIKHYYAYDAGGGLQTRKVRSIIVDKNEKVWAAQYNHRLIGTPPGAGTNTITIWPGTLAFKSRTSFDFNVKGNTYRCASQPAELPYPRDAFGDFMPDTALRNFQALSSDDTEVWASHWAYETKDDDCYSTHENLPARILRYNLNGTYQGSFTAGDMGFAVTNSVPAGDLITNICRNNEKGTWVTSSINNDGFSVYKNDTWIHISPADFPNVIPPNTGFNANATWKDENGKVYMGTNNGLIVYNGIGAVNTESSYKIYTNYDFGADPLSVNYDSYVFDETMISKNIFGGCTDPNDSRINWIATDNGIMKMGIREGVVLMYRKDHRINFNEDPTENIKFLSELPDSVLSEGQISKIAADGSKSTIFRIYTTTPEKYYGETPLLTPKVSINGVYPNYSNDSNEDDIKRFGKFEKKELSSYGIDCTICTDDVILSELKYVDFIYQHPEYIDSNDYESEYSIYGNIDFKIIDHNDVPVYSSVFKISVPPVLVLHGVWSNIYSVTTIRDYLKAYGFPDYTISVQWRVIEKQDDFAPENSFKVDSKVIPREIKELKKKAATNKFSVGKINVVAHSRGGLYTRGYIEEIESEGHLYESDINSLITLDTPHFGAQGANNVLDRRGFSYITLIGVNFVANLSGNTLAGLAGSYYLSTHTLGEIVASSSVPYKDREVNNEGGYDWGARNLLAQDDHVSGLNYGGDSSLSFIEDLNSVSNLQKLSDSGVPIHTIASIVDPCATLNWACLEWENTTNIAIDSPDEVTAKMILSGAVFQAIGSAGILNWMTDQLYHEPSDFIVPLSSQIGGLANNHTNTNPITDGIDHSGTVGISVARHPNVHSKILSLLKSNVYDATSAGLFSQTGLGTYTPLIYDFLENSPFLTSARNSSSQRNIAQFESKILLNRDPAIFDNRIEGDVLNFNVYQEDIDRILLVFKSKSDQGNSKIEMKVDNLSFQNNFSYPIPLGSGGKLTITAYGFKDMPDGGIVEHTITLDIGIPDTVTLQSIHFAVEEPIIYEQDNYSYTVMGTYSDGIDRILNNDDVTFTIENADILTQVDNNSVKGENVGISLLKASINGLDDTVKIKVLENPSLQQTILTSFYGIPDDTNTTIAINWETLREYENATFVLETSYNTPDNFTEVNQQAGNGTSNTPAQFNYDDSTFGVNTLIYYRIKMIDTQGNITYSSTIEINLSSSLGVEDNNLENSNLELYPNPTNTDKVILQLNSNFTDKNAKLEMYSLQGKRLSVQTLNVVEGTNSFNLKIGEGLVSGIYLVKVSTKGYVKTIKLIVDK